MKCPKCHTAPLRPREFFKLAHGAGPLMIQCNECYASLTWMNRKPLTASAGLASFAVATVVGVAGELFADQIDLVVRIAFPVVCAILTYAGISYRAWSRVVVRPSTLADLQSIPDAAAREMRTEETVFSYVYVAILLLAIGLTLFGAAGSKLAENIQTETEVSENVYWALAGGSLCILISVLIFRFRKRMAEATLENLHRKEIAWKALYASMGAEMVIKKFQSRRKRLVPFVMIPMLVGVAAIALALIIHGFEQTKWTDEEVIAVVAGFLLFGCGTIFLGMTFRCPVCLEPPWAAVPGAGRGMTLDPISCPTCGTPLKPEGIAIEGEIESLDSTGTLNDADVPKMNGGAETKHEPPKKESPSAALKTDAPKNAVPALPMKNTKPAAIPKGPGTIGSANSIPTPGIPKPSTSAGIPVRTTPTATTKNTARVTLSNPKVPPPPTKPDTQLSPKGTGETKL